MARRFGSRATRWARDIDGEQHRVGECEDEAQRLTLHTDVGQQIHARHRQEQRSAIAHRARAERGKADDRHEFDGCNGAQRQAVDGQVEDRVHDRQHGAPRQQQPTPAGIQAPDDTPRSAPNGEDERGREDPQPGHAENVDTGEEEGPRTPAPGSGRRR